MLQWLVIKLNVKNVVFIALFLMGVAGVLMCKQEWSKNYFYKAIDILNKLLRDTEEYIKLYLTGDFMSKFRNCIFTRISIILKTDLFINFFLWILTASLRC